MEIKAKGIDISKHNSIDWSKVKASEIGFCIMRAGYGLSTVDTQFKTNIENAIKLNIPIGIYWFSYATSVIQAKQEAEFCIKTITPYKQYIKYPIWFDWENDSEAYCKKNGVTPTKMLASDMAIAFMETIKTAGYKTGTYSNIDYLNRYFDNRVKAYPIWLAHVGKNGAARTTTTYTGNYDLWQYSWNGKQNGFSGNVDMDYAYVNYTDNTDNAQTSTSNQTAQTTANTSKYLVDCSKEQTSKVVTYSNAKQGRQYLSRHFQISEFKSPDSDVIKVDNRLIWILEKLFADLNCSKMIINSGYRTNAQSIKVGGYSGDTHSLGKASDITCYDKSGKIISAKTVCCKLCDYGDVFGIGYISETAVHCDSRDRISIWYGDETNGTSLLKSGYTSFDEYFNGKKLTVNSGNWNIRSQPNLSGNVLCVVKGGKQYKYTTVTNGWAYIPELKGWLSKSGYTVK